MFFFIWEPKVWTWSAKNFFLFLWTCGVFLLQLEQIRISLTFLPNSFFWRWLKLSSLSPSIFLNFLARFDSCLILRASSFAMTVMLQWRWINPHCFTRNIINVWQIVLSSSIFFSLSIYQYIYIYVLCHTFIPRKKLLFKVCILSICSPSSNDKISFSQLPQSPFSIIL